MLLVETDNDDWLPSTDDLSWRFSCLGYPSLITLSWTQRYWLQPLVLVSCFSALCLHSDVTLCLGWEINQWLYVFSCINQESKQKQRREMRFCEINEPTASFCARYGFTKIIPSQNKRSIQEWAKIPRESYFFHHNECIWFLLLFFNWLESTLG